MTLPADAISDLRFLTIVIESTQLPLLVGNREGIAAAIPEVNKQSTLQAISAGSGSVCEGRISCGFTLGEAGMGHLLLEGDWPTPEDCYSDCGLNRHICAEIVHQPESALAKFVASQHLPSRRKAFFRSTHHN